MDFSRGEPVGALEQLRHHFGAVDECHSGRDMQQHGRGRTENQRFHRWAPFSGRHICQNASAATIVYPNPIAQPPASVTMAK